MCLPLALAAPSSRGSRLPVTKCSLRSMCLLAHTDGRRRDRLDDLLISGAAAERAADRLADRVFTGDFAGMLVEKRFRGEDHAGNAIATLNGAAFNERLLQGM